MLNFATAEQTTPFMVGLPALLPLRRFTACNCPRTVDWLFETSEVAVAWISPRFQRVKDHKDQHDQRQQTIPIQNIRRHTASVIG